MKMYISILGSSRDRGRFTNIRKVRQESTRFTNIIIDTHKGYHISNDSAENNPHPDRPSLIFCGPASSKTMITIEQWRHYRSQLQLTFQMGKQKSKRHFNGRIKQNTSISQEFLFHPWKGDFLLFMTKSATLSERASTTLNLGVPGPHASL